MRFKEYLLEEPFKFDEEVFKKDCAFYFEQLGSFAKGHYLFHGSDDIPFSRNGLIRNFKARTRPTDTPKPIHNEVNKYFTEKFGYAFRNGLFVTDSAQTAEYFGDAKIIVPIGKFEWLCNVDPLFRDMTKMLDTIDKDDIVSTIKNSTDWYHNTDLKKCMLSDNEIMIKCDKFYAFDVVGNGFKLPESIKK